ncbi:hypothetical protein [Saccharibacter sp. 17.LH.SD]|nr:hypothetical protein [Saccharibacter sp. 17.LH.SD]
MLWKRSAKDPSAVPVIDMKTLIIIHVMLVVFIFLLHWRIVTLSDF